MYKKCYHGQISIIYFVKIDLKCNYMIEILGWSGGAMVLGKLSVPGLPTNLDHSRACSRCGLFGHFFSHLSFLFSFSLSLGDGPI